MNEKVNRMHRSGLEELPGESRLLKAGSLQVEYQGGELRYMSAGGYELVRRIYSALRDRNWNTIEGIIEHEYIEEKDDGFLVTFDSVHKAGDIDFSWKGRIEGKENGTVRFSMDGTAHSTFQRNRIGFCVLHPMALAGSRCTVTHPDGSVTKGTFPRYISPEQPFFDIRQILCDIGDDLQAEITFEGDIFEMEDQRNWTDASYKTYCTPLGLPFPVTVESGTAIRQAVTVRLNGASAVEHAPATEAVEISVGTSAGHPVLRLGTSRASHGEPLAPRELDLLSRLGLSHYRIDLRLPDASLEQHLREGWKEARALGASLEAAVHLGENPAEELKALAEAVRSVEPQAGRWLIFKQGEKSTSSKWIAQFRSVMEPITPEAEFVSGTDAFFTELNRGRPDTAKLDAVTWSINPQVHAFDNLSLTETLPAQATTVDTAYHFCGNDDRSADGTGVCISPVTFRMRWNPNATGPEPATPAGELPARVDPRQLSLFGAAWTLESIKYLSLSGVRSATWFETTGWYGMMEREEGSPLPDRFPSRKGQVFPLYFVFAWIAAMKDPVVKDCVSRAPLRADGFLAEDGNGKSLFLVNFSHTPVAVLLKGLQGSGRAQRLTAESMDSAVMEPERFLGTWGDRMSFEPQGTEIRLEGNEILHIVL